MKTSTESGLDPLLRLPAVRAATGLGRTTIYMRVKDGSFPAPTRLGAKSVAWQQSAVAKWIEDQVRASK
jgi:prophage regulatory protein